jgi:hypothetical protein
LLRTTHELSLSDDAKASVSKIEASLLAESSASMSGALAGFQADLASGIRAGKIDAAKLTGDYAIIDRAAAAQQAREAEALASLHGVLTGAERQSVASSVRSRRAMRDRLQPPASVDAGGSDWTKFRVEHLARELGLDVDAGQDKRLAAIIAAEAKRDPQGPGASDGHREEAKKRVEVVLAAFEADAFDAGGLPLAPPWLKAPHEGAERTATLDASLMPILTPEQREKLALRVQRFTGRPGRFPEDGPIQGGFEGSLEDMGPIVPAAPLGPLPR